jgi:glycine cleavage system H protein
MIMKFSETHEWIEENKAVATVGVSQYAQKELGEVVYIELPTIGKTVKVGDEVAVLESTKAAADVYSPASGEIVEVNQALSQQPELLNQSPESSGWIYKLKLSNPADLEKLATEASYRDKWK